MERKKGLEEGGKDVRNRRQTERKGGKNGRMVGEFEKEGRGRWKGEKRERTAGGKIEDREEQKREGRKQRGKEGDRATDCFTTIEHNVFLEINISHCS